MDHKPDVGADLQTKQVNFEDLPVLAPETGPKVKLSITVGKNPEVVKKSAEEIQIRNGQ